MSKNKQKIIKPTGYQLKVLPLADLKVYNNPNAKNNYQRPYVEKHAKDIADNMCPEALSILNVVERHDGSFVIADGQHNAAAMQMSGFTHADCKVWKSSGTKAQQWRREAEVFLYLNSKRRNLTKTDIFKALVARGEPRACHITRVLQGYLVKVEKGKNAWGFVSSVPCLERAYDRGSFDETIDVLNEAFSNHFNAFSGYLLEGVSVWIQRAKASGHWNKQVRDMLVCGLRGVSNPNSGNAMLASERTKQMKTAQDKFSGEARARYCADNYINVWYKKVAPKAMHISKPRATKKKVVKKKVARKKTATKK